MAQAIRFLETLRGLFAPKKDEVGKLKTVPFPELTAAWNTRCERFPFQPGAATGRRSAVVVTPWLGTPVPYYNLEVARALATRGEQVEVILDAHDVFGNAPNPGENELLTGAVAQLPSWLPVNRLDDSQPIETQPDDDALAERIIRENAVWRTRGESTADVFIDRKRDSVRRLSEHIARVRELIASRRIEWLLIPGGIWGISRAYVTVAQKAGLRFATYDTGGSLMVFNQDGIAAHQSDLPKAFAMVLEATDATGRARMIEWARHELNERMQGRGNYFKFQSVPVSGTPAGDPNIFVPLNLRWDSAALGRERLFPSVKDWVTAIVRWAATEPRARVCFRQHPAERHKSFRTTDDVGALVQQLNTAGDRVRFVTASDPVNSYDLLGQVRALLPFTSSMGAEAPMLGIPVITSAHNYYDSFPFVNRAESPEHYFQLLGRALDGELTVSDEQKDLAAVVYCLVQHCNFMTTGFTAAPTDFLEWVKVAPDELWQRLELQDLQRALETGEPLSFIRQQRFVSEAA